jgi:hypothetical protein
MTDLTIHNFRYFLEELEKNLRQMESLFEQESIALENMHVLHGVMSKMCENWSNQLEHKK